MHTTRTSGPSHRFRAGGLLLLTLIAVVACAGIGVSTTAARAKPDLVIRNLKFVSSPAQSTSPRVPVAVLENDGHGRFGIHFKVKNLGDRRAGAGKAHLFIGGSTVNVAVGPIPAGGSRLIHKSFNPRIPGPGQYKFFACADWGDAVNESRERNNCSPDKRFHAVPRRWDVRKFTVHFTSTDGEAPFSDAAAGTMHMSFFGVVKLGGEERLLWLAHGGVTGKVSGYDGVCTYSGSGSASHSPWDVNPPAAGYLEMDADVTEYAAEVKDDDAGFTSTQTCPGYPPNEESAGILPLETYGADGDFHGMDSDAKVLTGNKHFDLFAGMTSDYSWSFKAVIP